MKFIIVRDCSEAVDPVKRGRRLKNLYRTIRHMYRKDVYKSKTLSKGSPFRGPRIVTFNGHYSRMKKRRVPVSSAGRKLP